MHSMIGKSRLFGAVVMGLLCGGVAQGRALSAGDYAQAARFMSYNTVPLVDHAVTKVDWLDDGHFWYVDHDASGDHFVQMDAASGKITPLFDQVKLAAALGKASGKPVDAKTLPVTGYAAKPDGRIDVTLHGKHYLCDLAAAEASCVDRATVVKTGKEPGALSPDKKSEAFIRDWNLWLRDVASGKEIQLTTDGVENFGYATDNAGWKHTDKAIVEWSPDSKRIATFQQDQRKTGEMYLIRTRVGHPELEKWKYPLVGDKDVTMIERVIIDVPTHKVVRLKMPPDQHRSSLCDDVSCGPDGGWDDVKWAADGKTLAFVSTSRDHKHEWFRIADAGTGKVRTVFEETVPTYYESGNGAVNWRYLPETNEAIWFSERNNWGNLYLYDLGTGKLKHAITTGEGNVTEVLKVDPKTRTVWFRGVGRTAGVNPYYQQFFKVGLDGGKPVLLTPEAADHTVTLSPDGKSFVDAYSTPTVPPVTVLRSANDDRKLASVANADISRLKAAGWVPPIPFTVKARDGKTDLYGMMFKPSHFDPSKKYPIIDYIYPGPQTGSVRGRSFLVRARRPPVDGRAGFHRGGDRRHGHAVALQGVPRRLLRARRGQHAARPGGRPEGTRQTLSVDRPRPRRHLGPLRRRQRQRRRDVPLPRLLQGRLGRKRQPRQPQLRGRLGREVAGSAGHRQGRQDQLRRAGQPEFRQEPQGPPDADLRHARRQRAAVQHAAGGRGTDQGQPRLRHDRDPQRASWLCRRHAVHHPPPLGLLRAVPGRQHAADGVQAEGVALALTRRAPPRA